VLDGEQCLLNRRSQAIDYSEYGVPILSTGRIEARFFEGGEHG
jgi:hypothetical protein